MEEEEKDLTVPKVYTCDCRFDLLNLIIKTVRTVNPRLCVGKAVSPFTGPLFLWDKCIMTYGSFPMCSVLWYFP